MISEFPRNSFTITPKKIQFWDRAQELFAKAGQRATGNGQRYIRIQYMVYTYTLKYIILIYFHTIIITHVIVLRIYIYISIYTVYWLMYVYLLVLMDHDLDTLWGLM